MMVLFFDSSPRFPLELLRMLQLFGDSCREHLLCCGLRWEVRLIKLTYLHRHRHSNNRSSLRSALSGVAASTTPGRRWDRLTRSILECPLIYTKKI